MPTTPTRAGMFLQTKKGAGFPPPPKDGGFQPEDFDEEKT